jgi:hypothetical protein
VGRLGVRAGLEQIGTPTLSQLNSTSVAGARAGRAGRAGVQQCQTRRRDRRPGGKFSQACGRRACRRSENPRHELRRVGLRLAAAPAAGARTLPAGPGSGSEGPSSPSHSYRPWTRTVTRIPGPRVTLPESELAAAESWKEFNFTRKARSPSMTRTMSPWLTVTSPSSPWRQRVTGLRA